MGGGSGVKLASAMQMSFRPTFSCTAAALACCVVVGGLGTWHFQLVSSEAELEAKLRVANAKTAIVAAQQKDADAARARFAVLQRLEAQFAAEHLAPRWASVLKTLVTSHGAGMRIDRIDVRAKTGAAEACELHISGTATGLAPARTSAEQFRQSLLLGLEALCREGTVSVEFASLEDLPNKKAGEARCVFELKGNFTPAPGAGFTSTTSVTMAN